MKKIKISDINTNENRFIKPVVKHKNKKTPSTRLSEIYRNSYDIGKDYYFKRLAQAVYGFENNTLNTHIYLFNKYEIHRAPWAEIEKLVVDIAQLQGVEIVDESLFQWLYSNIPSDDGWPYRRYN